MLVLELVPDGPGARRRAVQRGDVVVAFDGEPIAGWTTCTGR